MRNGLRALIAAAATALGLAGDARADLATGFSYGPTVPSSCTEPQLFLDTDGPAGERWYICEEGTYRLYPGGWKGVYYAADYTTGSNTGGIQEAFDASCTDKGAYRVCGEVRLPCANDQVTITRPIVIGSNDAAAGSNDERSIGGRIVGCGSGAAQGSGKAGAISTILADSGSFQGFCDGATPDTTDGTACTDDTPCTGTTAGRCIKALVINHNGQHFGLRGMGLNGNNVVDYGLALLPHHNSEESRGDTTNGHYEDLVIDGVNVAGILNSVEESAVVLGSQAEHQVFKDIVVEDTYDQGMDYCYRISNQQTQGNVLQNFECLQFDTAGFLCEEGHLSISGGSAVSNNASTWAITRGANCVTTDVQGFFVEGSSSLNGLNTSGAEDRGVTALRDFQIIRDDNGAGAAPAVTAVSYAHETPLIVDGLVIRESDGDSDPDLIFTYAGQGGGSVLDLGAITFDSNGTSTTDVDLSGNYNRLGLQVDLGTAANPCAALQAAVDRFLVNDEDVRLRVTGKGTVTFSDLTDRGTGGKDYSTCLYVASTEDKTDVLGGGSLQIEWDNARLVYDDTGDTQTNDVVLIQLGDKYGQGASGGYLSSVVQMSGNLHIRTDVDNDTGWSAGVLPVTPFATGTNGTSLFGVFISGATNNDWSDWALTLQGNDTDQNDVAVYFQYSWGTQLGGVVAKDWAVGFQGDSHMSGSSIQPAYFQQNKHNVVMGNRRDPEDMRIHDDTAPFSGDGTKGMAFLGGVIEGADYSDVVIFAAEGGDAQGSSSGTNFTGIHFERAAAPLAQGIIIGAGICAAGADVNTACVVDADCAASTCNLIDSVNTAIRDLRIQDSIIAARVTNGWNDFAIGPAALQQPSDQLFGVNLSGSYFRTAAGVDPIQAHSTATIPLMVDWPMPYLGTPFTAYDYLTYPDGQVRAITTTAAVTPAWLRNVKRLVKTGGSAVTLDLPEGDWSARSFEVCDDGSAGSLTLDPGTGNDFRVDGTTLATDAQITSTGRGWCVAVQGLDATTWIVTQIATPGILDAVGANPITIGSGDVTNINVNTGTGALAVTGSGTFTGSLSAASLAVDPSATPTLSMQDSDMGGTPDQNVQMVGNCPTGTTAGGNEDCDATLAVQSGGTITGMIMLDTTDAAVTTINLGATTSIGTPPNDALVISEAGLLTFAGTGSGIVGVLADSSAAPADPADAGAIRMDNAETICWEASPAGTDVCISVDASEIVQVTGGTFDAGDLSGTVPVATVGADHIDAISEIDAAIKRGPDATDTHLLTTDVAAPAGARCLEMDTDGSVILAADTCASLGPGGSTAIDALADAGAGDDAVALADDGQTWTWDTPATATARDALSLVFNHDAGTDATTQRGLVVERDATAGTATLETLVQINNNDTDGAVTTALEVTSAAGTIGTALDLSDPEIGVAIALGSNEITTTGPTTISEAELDLLDGHNAALVDTNDEVGTAITGSTADTFAFDSDGGSTAINNTSLVFEGSGAADANDTTFSITNPTAARTVTVPDASTTLPVFGQLLTFAGPTAARTVTFPDADFIAMSTDTTQSVSGAKTFTVELTADDLGIEFTPGDTLTDCSTFAATGGGIFYDDSEGKFKKCQDNTLTDLDTVGGAGVWTQSGGVLFPTTSTDDVGNDASGTNWLITDTGTATFDGTVTSGPAASPQILFTDSDNSGEAKILVGDAPGPESTMTLSVDTGAGADTPMVQLDGVNDRVEIGDGGTTNYVAISTAGAVTFAGTGSFTAPSSAGAAPTANGVVAYDSTSHTLEYGANATNRTVANLGETQTFSGNKSFTGTLTVPFSAGAAPTTGSGLVAVDTTSNTLEYSSGGSNFIAMNLAGAQTAAGNKTFSGAGNAFTGGVAIPNGTAPTIDAAGEIALDTTDIPSVNGAEQLIVDDGTNDRVLPFVQQACAVVENLADADDNFPIWTPLYAVVVQAAHCECHGTCTTEADVTFERDQGGSITGITGTVACEDTTVGGSLTALSGAGATLSALDTLRFDTTAPTPETDKYTICWSYLVTRQ